MTKLINDNKITALTYKIELPQFEGPLDLLLNLIEQEELDITKISLARVTDQFLEHLELLREINPDELSDFLTMAAKLVLIKSEVLLPRPPPSIIEDDEEDVGDELARQLIIYKQFKDISVYLRELETEGRRTFVRMVPEPPKVEPKLVAGTVSLDRFLNAARTAFTIKPPEPSVDEVIAPEIVTISEQMNHIRESLRTHQHITFQKLLSPEPNRLEVIITLLALLELIKRQLVKAQQSELFGDIIVQPHEEAPEFTEGEWLELTESDFR